MFCMAKKKEPPTSGWGRMKQMFLKAPQNTPEVRGGKARLKEEAEAERQQREEREREREQELRRLREEVAALQKQVAETDGLRYEIRRLQGQSATWTSVFHSALFTLILHPSLSETFRLLFNQQLRHAIADMDIISSAECLSLSLPPTAERTPDIELCEAYAASGTTGASLWRVRLPSGSVSAELHVTGKKMVKFKADLTVSFTFEALLIVAMYPRGTEPELLPTNLPIPSTAGLITRVTKVPLDVRRTRFLGKVPNQPHCWLQMAVVEQPKFEVPIQSKVTAAKLALPVQDRIRAAIQKAVGKLLEQRLVAPANFMVPITINAVDNPARLEELAAERPTHTDQLLQSISNLVGKEQKWDQAKDICAGLDATNARMQPLLTMPGVPSIKVPRVATAAMVAAYVQVTNADQHQDWTELMETAAQFVTMQVGAERAAQLMHTAKQLCVGQTPAPTPPPAPAKGPAPVPPAAPKPRPAPAAAEAAPPPPLPPPPAPPAAPAAPTAPTAIAPLSPPPGPPPTPVTHTLSPTPSQTTAASGAKPSPAVPAAAPALLPSASAGVPAEALTPPAVAAAVAEEAQSSTRSPPDTPSDGPLAAEHRREASRVSLGNSFLAPDGRQPSLGADPHELPDTENLLADPQPQSLGQMADNIADDLRAMNAKVLKKLDEFKWSDITGGSSDKPPKSAQDEVLTQVQRTVKGAFGKWDQVSKTSRGTLSTKFCEAMGISQSSTAAIIGATGLADAHKAASVATAALVVGYIQLTAPLLQRDWEELRQSAALVVTQYLGGSDVDVASEVHAAAKIALLEAGAVKV